MGAYPFLSSTEFTKPWYQRMVEGFDEQVRSEMRGIEAEIAYQEKQLAKAGSATARVRTRTRLHEAQCRLQDYIDFYGGE